jgi:hypothetical protein
VSPRPRVVRGHIHRLARNLPQFGTRDACAARIAMRRGICISFRFVPLVCHSETRFDIGVGRTESVRESECRDRSI